MSVKDFGANRKDGVSFRNVLSIQIDTFKVVGYPEPSIRIVQDPGELGLVSACFGKTNT